MAKKLLFSLSSLLMVTLVLAVSGASAQEKVAATATPDREVPELGDKSYEKWLRYVMPDEKASAWRKIGWRTSFFEALAEAKKTQRPILLWVMNGHPCGSV